jgi:hypothetical protein
LPERKLDTAHGDTMVARWKGEKEIKNAKGFIMQIYKR